MQGTTGMPIIPEFTVSKISWLMKNNEEVRIAVEEDRCYMGTVDSWLIWVSMEWRVHTNCEHYHIMVFGDWDWCNTVSIAMECWCIFSIFIPYCYVKITRYQFVQNSCIVELDNTIYTYILVSMVILEQIFTYKLHETIYS